MQKIALIGNPNCGKTTLFNVLTGANQKVGNWPGVTVEKKFGYFELEDNQIELIDLPGVYSLEQEHQGIDEKIATDYIAQSELNIIVNIIDATNLERSLVLTQQLLEQSVPVIVVLNMLDVAEQQGVAVSRQALADSLQVPIIEMVASRKRGVDNLLDCFSSVLADPDLGRSKLDAEDSDGITDRILKRYYQSRRLVDGVVEVSPTHHSLSQRIDRVVLNRWLGIPFFLLMIYLMFTFAVNLGAVFIDFFDILFAAVLVDGTGWLLQQIAAPPVGNYPVCSGPGWRYYPGCHVYTSDRISVSLPVGTRGLRIHVSCGLCN